MEAKLIWKRMSQNKAGFLVGDKEESVEVFADEKEVVRSEFYEAMRSGISVKKVFSLRVEDFELSRHRDNNKGTAYADYIEYDGERYKIIRTYKANKSKIELTCGGEV